MLTPADKTNVDKQKRTADITNVDTRIRQLTKPMLTPRIRQLTKPLRQPEKSSWNSRCFQFLSRAIHAIIPLIGLVLASSLPFSIYLLPSFPAFGMPINRKRKRSKKIYLHELPLDYLSQHLRQVCRCTNDVSCKTFLCSGSIWVKCAKKWCAQVRPNLSGMPFT